MPMRSALLLWVAACLLCSAASADKARKLRVYIDADAWIQGMTGFMREAIDRVPGAVLAGISTSSEDRGFKHMDQWDMLWTISKEGSKIMSTGSWNRSINTMPGFFWRLIHKGGMAEALDEAYGDQAPLIVPLSFVLPGRKAKLERHMQALEAAGKGSEMWVLKRQAHRGMGVTPVEAEDLMDELERSNKADKMKYTVAQRVIPRLWGPRGSPWLFRIWFLVMGMEPVPRVYLYAGGGITYDMSPEAERLEYGAFHMVNPHKSKQARISSLGELHGAIDAAAGSPAAYDAIWDGIRRQIAAATAAALPHARFWFRRNMPAALKGGMFEMFGADVVLDEWMRPKIIEINNNPGMLPRDIDSRGHNADRQALFDALLHMLTSRHRAVQRGELGLAQPPSPEQLQRQEERIARSYGFIVLTDDVAEAERCALRRGSTRCAYLTRLEGPKPTSSAKPGAQCRLRRQDVLLYSLAQCPRRGKQ